MPLTFSKTWDQALVAVVVREAAKAEECYLSTVALKKILYFLQIAGVPMRYNFDLYHYGPHCDRVFHDLEMLLADGVLKDTSMRSAMHANYRLGPGAVALIETHALALAPHLKTIDTVIQAIRPIDLLHLEIITTLDYLYRYLKAGGGHGPWKDRVLKRFQEVKKDKFAAEEASDAYDSMARAGLVEL